MKAKSNPAAVRASRVTVESPARPRFRLWAFLPWAVLLASIVFVAVVRVRLLQIPIERDEGEYAYAGQLLLHGVPPYRDACNMKFPGIYAAYALMMGVFGETLAGIHLGFLLCNAATIVLVFFLGRRLLGTAAGAAASAAYALMALSGGVYGTQAHATHFVVLPVVAACILLLRAIDTRHSAWLFCSGILFGVGVLMKQHGVFFAALGPIALLWDRRSPQAESWTSTVRKVAIFVAGFIVPLVLTAIALWAAGVFDRFWFWTFTYAREYVTETSLSSGIEKMSATFPNVIGSNLFLWLLAMEGLVVIWWKKEDRPVAVFVTASLACAFLGICPGLYFREHYYVLMLPSVALLAAAGFRSLQRPMGNTLAVSLFATILLFSVYQQSDIFFRLSPQQITRRIYWYNPFPEAIPIADYIRTHSPGNARIAVLGSEPEIYFYAHRRSATGYIYTYALMEPQPYALRMQNEMIHDIETVRPGFIVLVSSLGSWDVRKDSSHHILEWWETYGAQHYKMAGFAEVLADHTEYHWVSTVPQKPKGDVILIVFERTN